MLKIFLLLFLVIPFLVYLGWALKDVLLKNKSRSRRDLLQLIAFGTLLSAVALYFLAGDALKEAAFVMTVCLAAGYIWRGTAAPNDTDAKRWAAELAAAIIRKDGGDPTIYGLEGKFLDFLDENMGERTPSATTRWAIIKSFLVQKVWIPYEPDSLMADAEAEALMRNHNPARAKVFLDQIALENAPAKQSAH